MSDIEFLKTAVPRANIDLRRVDSLLEEMGRPDVEPLRRARLAQAVLHADPQCIDGYVVLAQHTKTDAEAIALLKEAVRLGAEHWGQQSRTEQVSWWHDVATRSYLRALLGLSIAFARAGNEEAAQAALTFLLQLDPDDYLHATYCDGAAVGDDDVSLIHRR